MKITLVVLPRGSVLCPPLVKTASFSSVTHLRHTPHRLGGSHEKIALLFAVRLCYDPNLYCQ